MVRGTVTRIQAKIFVELGSSRFKAAVASELPSRNKRIYLASVPSAGVKNGDIINRDDATSALNILLENLSSLGFSKFTACELCLPQAITQERRFETKISLLGQKVGSKHAQSIRDNVLNQEDSEGVEGIDVDILEWLMNGSTSKDLPLGSEGPDLCAQGIYSFIDRQALQRIVDIFNTCGLEVLGTHSSAMGMSHLINRLSPTANNRVILDIGFNSTTGIVGVGQKPTATFLIKAGSNHITKDLSAALKIDYEKSEQLKVSLGLSLAGFPISSRSKLLLSSNVTSKGTSTTNHEVVYPWIAPRVAEIFSLALRHFAIYAKALDGGVVLTGGGSQLIDLANFLNAKFPGLSIVRFKPDVTSLSSALGIQIVTEGEMTSLSGFEAIVDIASRSEYSDSSAYRVAMLHNATPSFLRPLFTWFADIAK
jgi:cell division protein FtsA